MRDVEGERRVIYGLRDRATGEMLRVKPVTEMRYDDDSEGYPETEYHLTADSQHPVYDAGTADRLALVFGNTYGSEPDSPLANGVRPESVEPVAVEEIISRKVSPTGIPFDVPVMLTGIRYAADLNRAMARSYEGLGEVLDVIKAHDDAIKSRLQPGGAYAWGSYHVVGLLLEGDADALPEGVMGSIVSGPSGAISRRALVPLAMPENLLHLAEGRSGVPAAATLLVCLSDHRSMPEGLADALRELSPGNSPSPR